MNASGRWGAALLGARFLAGSAGRRFAATSVTLALEEAVNGALGLTSGRLGSGVLARGVVQSLKDRLGCTHEELLHKILPLAKHAALPHASGYHVGAAALGSSGSVFLGFNLELPGMPFQFTVHAEQSAVYLAADAKEERLCLLATSTTPCGHCRQFMQELYGGDSLEVSCPGQSTRSLGELLPDHFGPQHLGFESRLLRAPDHRVHLDGAQNSSDSQLLDMAVAAARKSYVPFGSPAGLALRTRTGHAAAGFPVESVAHNPGMTTAGPLQGALVKLTAQGCRDWRHINEAVLVECRDAQIKYAELVKLAMANIAPDSRLSVSFIDSE
eukprot:CAMPEP_0204583706 /NCGR_PEP_ID=MMETSP0661-20131031/45923_1 /ASSEMBLY_ACC=CAM_ASM_000606 /TAXON_ID=109239 /ORGANISM="Alexandrium margalefi, Strain AMGDE01CS-322" /LENGTH=327 /DNA_ID=CAMNT_0051593085 /DNA_START=50 /DNA_END=1033 /DNA_ORIENTATION=+